MKILICCMTNHNVLWDERVELQKMKRLIFNNLKMGFMTLFLAGLALFTVNAAGSEALSVPQDMVQPKETTVVEVGGDVSGGDVSGGDVSGGDVSGGDVSGGDVSGGDTSGGDVSGGQLRMASFFPTDGGMVDMLIMLGLCLAMGMGGLKAIKTGR